MRLRPFVALLALLSATDASAFGHGATRGALTKRQAKKYAYGDVHDPSFVLPEALGLLHGLVKQHPDLLTMKTIGQANGLPIYRIGMKPGPTKSRRLRVLVSAGVHGDEPTGVLAAIDLVRRAVTDRGMKQHFELTILPANNPTGLVAKTRDTGTGQNLNRAFPDQAPEAKVISRSLAGERFDLFVDLHGALGDGFFLIRGKDDGDMSRRILSAMGKGGLLEKPHLAVYDVHALGGATSTNAGTFKAHMFAAGVPYSYTLEYPRRLSPKLQRAGLVKLLRSTMDNVRTHGHFE